MAKIVQSQPKVVNTQKRVKEEIVRFYTNPTNLPTPNNILPGQNIEMELFPGSGATYYTVRTGEGVELLALGIKPEATVGVGPTYGWMDELTVQDWNSAEWNKFSIVPEERSLQNSNELPFSNALNFERKMMSWGFKSFLTSSTDIAPTLKMPEGDRLRLFARASPNGTANVTVSVGRGAFNPAYAVVRRYLPGSNIDYKHFDQYDGGIKSTKRYYNDYQQLATTAPGQYTDAWTLTIIRNEAYKFFSAGIYGFGANATLTPATTQLEGKIIIDDPMTEYNKYFVKPMFNNLPFVDTYSVYEPIVAGLDTFQNIEKVHRFAPTIDIVKNRNKDLKVKVNDDGTARALNVITRLAGVRYIL
jgi:hypothetical protein